jgi:hypothetical protein
MNLETILNNLVIGFCADTRTITLQPIAMLIPTSQCIYAPSRLREPLVIGYREFLTKFADHPRPALVSFEPDCKSSPQAITSYGLGLDCWYIVAGVQG